MKDYQYQLYQIVAFEWKQMLEGGPNWKHFERFNAVSKAIIYSNVEMWGEVKDDFHMLYDIYLMELCK